MNILELLKKEIVGKQSLDDMISVFEEMCEIPIEEELEKMILFETGTYSFAGKPMFNFSFDNSSYEQATWSFEIEDNIFDYIKKTKEYMCLKDIPIAKIEVYMDET